MLVTFGGWIQTLRRSQESPWCNSYTSWYFVLLGDDDEKTFSRNVSRVTMSFQGKYLPIPGENEKLTNDHLRSDIWGVFKSSILTRLHGQQSPWAISALNKTHHCRKNGDLATWISSHLSTIGLFVAIKMYNCTKNWVKTITCPLVLPCGLCLQPSPQVLRSGGFTKKSAGTVMVP